MAGCSGNETISTLKNTKWQLAGYVNISTKEIIKAEPEGGGYYTITFDTDTTAAGHSIFNVIVVSLNTPSIHSTTEIDDSMNGNAELFYEAIRTIESYEVDDSQLKFYYGNKQYYLLFNKK